MAQREPCPGRIMDDLGGAFAMGCTGGGIFYFLRGFYYSPSRERMRGALNAVKNRAPLLGGSFAMWGGLFATFDCSLLMFTKKDNSANAILSGFLTGGVLAARAGFQIAWRNAVAGGLILGIIEGVNVAYTTIMIRSQMQMLQEIGKIQEEKIQRQMQGLPDFTPEEINARLQPPKKPGFLARLFGAGEDEE